MVEVKKYHINYETGNPGVCRAQVKCPFGADLSIEHYADKESARAVFEDYMENPMSTGSRLVLDRYKIQSDLLRGKYPFSEVEKFNEAINRRNAYDKLLHRKYEGNERKNSQNPDLSSAKKPHVLKSLAFHDQSRVIGFTNDFEGIVAEQTELVDKSDAASIAWVKTLTDREVDAVKSYSCGSESYSRSFSTSEKHEISEHLHSALSKAPRIPGTHVYSGLSRYTRDTVLSAIENQGEVFEIDRALSTTLNPAQINGFMRNNEEENNRDDYVALEIETNEGALMNAISSSPQEMEILIPPGRYELVSERRDVEFLWNEEMGGRKADRVLRLKRLDTS